MTTSSEATLNYYNRHAAAYFAQTHGIVQQDLLQAFIACLPAGGRILDVGCGSGRDSKFFLDHGFQVTPFDASEGLAQQASHFLNHPVAVHRIEEMHYEDEFDGVWAQASLLHLPKSQLPQALTRCARALKQSSTRVFFCSFKAGKGEGPDALGRHFSYYDLQELQCAFEQAGLLVLQSFHNPDAMQRSDTTWLCFILQTPSPAPNHRVFFHRPTP